jgi:hypothetical protein
MPVPGASDRAGAPRAKQGEWIRGVVAKKTFADLLLPKVHFSKRVERGGGYRARAMAMAGTWQGLGHLNAQVKGSGFGAQ